MSAPRMSAVMRYTENKIRYTEKPILNGPGKMKSYMNIYTKNFQMETHQTNIHNEIHEKTLVRLLPSPFEWLRKLCN